jgi:beta-1,4-mannooligosaccharide/beta-1,4-mannosyl-N-acetylglucosamine phosphorylase
MTYAKIDRDVLVRHPANPILSAAHFRDQLGLRMRAVYNSSAFKVAEGRYVMLCRTNQLNHLTLLWGADSTDGIHWKLRPEPFEMPQDDLWKRVTRSVYYDPRITRIDGEFKVLIACEGDQNCRVAMFRSTDDLQTLEFVNYVNVPDNRNMVIFPEKSADGRYMRLERPSIPAHGGKGGIWLSHSPDLIHWGDSHEVLKTTELWNFAYSGLGASTVPHRTADGWLILFHAIMNNCTTREYSIGAALLDLEKPWIVRHLAKHPILAPEAEYEMRGLVEHVCFPCAKIVEPDGTVKVYYGAADTVQCVATGQLSDILHACKNW